MEVALFLAVSGLLFVGIAAGVQNSVWQQRVNDSVQSFAEFLKTVYSQVSNPQGANTTGGRSDQAIYGKLISFGQTYGLDGDLVASDKQEIFVYDVIGDAESKGTGGTLSLLKELNPNVVVIKDSEIQGFAGMVENYVPRWTAAVQPQDSDTEFYKGTILILRNPRSGTISTFVSGSVLNINQNVKENKVSNLSTMLKDSLDGFALQRVDFCINQNGNNADKNRRNVRLLSGANNASGVVIVGDDDNVCNK